MDFLSKLAQFNPFSKSNQNEEYYFALNVEEKKVEASLWGIKGHRIAIVNATSLKYSGHQSLIEQGNLALDEVLGDFPIEPEKILFGVPDSWLQDEDLTPEHLTLLRKMVKAWGLTPMAYVSTTQAIAHFLQKTQGVPLTGIIIKVAEKIQVSVVKAGKILASGEHVRSEHLAKDVERVLMSFSEIEVLPSKVLVYGEENFPKLKDDLQSFPWMSNLPFLHLPKIEELPKNIQMASICLAGAVELNPNSNFNTNELDHLAEGVTAQHKLSRHIPSEGLPHHNRHRESLEPGGFVAGDIKDFEGENPEFAEEMVEMEEEVWGDENPSKEMVKHHPNLPEQHKEEHLGVQPRGGAPVSLVASLIAAPLGFLKGGGLLGNKLILLGVVILIFLIGGFLLLPKATVTVFIDMRTLDKEAEVMADPNITVVDENAKKIPGEIVSTSVSGAQRGSATGKKKVGDPAKGSVLIYNKTLSPKTFSSGTAFVGPNNLTFTLDSSVNVASQSAVDGGISFGKASAGVTASEIGPDGNLAAGTELSIKNESSSNYSAKVDQAFSGGLSKDVTVVTADDQKRLLALLTSDLRSKAQGQIQGKLSGDMKILTQALQEQITSQQYSKKVGDQASDFNLDMTINYKGTAYKDEDLKSIVSKLVSINIPNGYSLDISQTETQADVSKVNKDGTIVFLAKFKAKLMPKLDTEKLKKDLVFKTFDQANVRVKQIENVIGSDVKMTPFTFPGPLKRLPILSKNISIEVTAK